MNGFIRVNCESREHCKNKDSFACNSCVRNQSYKRDNYEYEAKPLRFDITCDCSNANILKKEDMDR